MNPVMVIKDISECPADKSFALIAVTHGPHGRVSLLRFPKTLVSDLKLEIGSQLVHIALIGEEVARV